MSDEAGTAPDERAAAARGDERIPLVELVIMVASVLFAVGLFAFAVWQAMSGVGAAPPEVAPGGHVVGPDDSVVYTVVLANPGDAGLVVVTVEAGCTDPPAELVFEHVPATGRRVGTVVCPPGTTDPRLSVASWIRE